VPEEEEDESDDVERILLAVMGRSVEDEHGSLSNDGDRTGENAELDAQIAQTDQAIQSMTDVQDTTALVQQNFKESASASVTERRNTRGASLLPALHETFSATTDRALSTKFN